VLLIIMLSLYNYILFYGVTKNFLQSSTKKLYISVFFKKASLG
jgi:hypothetical protein